MHAFTTQHYVALEQKKFELFVVQDGLEILFRALLVLGVLWLLLALNVVIDWRKHVRQG